MKNNKPQLNISLSREHQKYKPDVADAFSSFDVSFNGDLMRFSAAKMPMQLIIFLGGWAASNIAWDLLKLAIKNLYTRFKNARITLRDSQSVMYTVNPDLTIGVLVVPDRAKEFEHIKTIDDLVGHLKKIKEKNIPNDWNLIPVGDVFTFVKTYAFSRDNLETGKYEAGKIGNIHYGDIHSTYVSSSIDLNNIPIPMIKDTKFIPKNADLLKDGDLIMADASEDYAGVGVTVSVHGLKGKKVVGGLHTFVLRDDKNKTDEYYRQYLFRNPNLRNKLQKVANGVSVYGVSKTAVSKILLPLPALAEQKRISEVLKTWDRIIEKLASKIEIKRNIKKGLTQKLLTGKTRLSGFKDKWQNAKMGNLVMSVRERNKKLQVLRILSVTNKYGFILPEEQFARVVASQDLSNYKVITKGDFAYNPSRINVGSISRLDKYDTGILSPMYIAFRPRDNIFSDYLYQWIFTKEANSKIKNLASGSVRASVDFKSFCTIKIRVPVLEEQKAIAKIINTANAEIKELENKLAGFLIQKKYLLNNLITGEIRTPVTLSFK